MHYLLWLVKIPFYFFFLTLGALLSGLIVLSSMKSLVGYRDQKGSVKYATLHDYPKWAWLWKPASNKGIDGVKFYNENRKLSPFDIFKRRLAYFFFTKSTNFNTKILGIKVNSYCIMKGNVNITNVKQDVKNLSYLWLRTDNGNWRYLIRYKNSFIIDLGYKLGLNNNELKLPYRARMLCRLIRLRGCAK